MMMKTGVSICDFLESAENPAVWREAVANTLTSLVEAGAMLTFEGLVQDIIQRRGKLGSKELDGETKPDIGDVGGN